MATTSAKRIFVSYTKADETVASEVADALRRAGHAVTIQSTDFRPGTNFVLEMQRGLSDADHVIAVLSPEYEQSAFAAPEWAAAFVRDPAADDRHLIGVRAADYRPTGLLAALVYVDLVNQPFDEAMADLLGSVGEEPVRPADVAAATKRREPSSIPHRAGRFVGRRDDIADVVALLASGSAVALTGMGGIGKTSLAAEVVHHSRRALDVALWLYAPDRQRALEEAARVAEAHGLDVADPDDALRTLGSFIDTFGNALVVLDGCPDPDLAHLLVSEVGGSALVTSRTDRGWSGRGFEQRRVGVLTHDEAVDLLVAAAPSGDDGADAVAAHLQGLPLALVQAATYVDQHGLTFRDYLDRLVAHPGRALDTPPDGYDETVLSVWTLSLDELDTDFPAAAQLLRILSMLDSQDFPRSVIDVGASVLPEPLRSVGANPFDLDETSGQLLRQSLCNAIGDGLAVHPVVQAVVRGRMDASEQRELMVACVRMLRHAAPAVGTPDTWPTWMRLGPHITTIAARAMADDGFIADLRPLMTELSDVLAQRGYPHFARFLRSEVLQYVVERIDAASAYDVVASLHDLAESHLQLRSVDRAAALFEQVVAMDEEFGEAESARSIASQTGLASALTDLDQIDRANEVLAVAASRYEDRHADDPDLGLRLYGTWGRSLSRAANFDEARDRLRTALSLAEQADAPMETALTLLHIGNLEMAARDPEAARRSFELALGAAGTTADAHELRANILASLGGAAIRLSRHEEALRYTEEGLRALDELPEGELTVTAALLHFQRAQLRANNGDATLVDVVAEVGPALDVLCDHLPIGHRDRRVVAHFLAKTARSIGDDELLRQVHLRERDV